MKTSTLAVALLMTGTASAAPLLGSTQSFFNTSFCRTYHCTLTSKEPLTKTIVDFRYTITDSAQDSFPTLSVIRINNVITSIGFVTGAQDSIFYPGSVLGRMWASVISTATGASVSEQKLAQLDDNAGIADGKEVIVRAGKFTVGCVNSYGEYQGSRQITLRVY